MSKLGLLSKQLPLCKFKHPDCFALSEHGFCQCLSDNDFGKKDCPFYRNKDIVHAEWKEMDAREKAAKTKKVNDDI